MGCLNAGEGFSHWFGNIHLSGPCNRSCYFCIGQHMMALDTLNTLDTFPLPGMVAFVLACREHGVSDVNLTGSNTDPLLYRHTRELRAFLSENIDGLRFGVRTNGARALADPVMWRLFDKASISIPSFNPVIYRAMMGSGNPPPVRSIVEASKGKPLKVNIVLGPENTSGGDLRATLNTLDACGIRKVNLREPYGQPHIGDPLDGLGNRVGTVLGMPLYRWRRMEVVYWDVHYVEVESVNLYANGNVSVLYPITKGHDDATGDVRGQEHFTRSGRTRPQWVSPNRPTAETPP